MKLTGPDSSWLQKSENRKCGPARVSEVKPGQKTLCGNNMCDSSGLYVSASSQSKRFLFSCTFERQMLRRNLHYNESGNRKQPLIGSNRDKNTDTDIDIVHTPPQTHTHMHAQVPCVSHIDRNTQKVQQFCSLYTWLDTKHKAMKSSLFCSSGKTLKAQTWNPTIVFPFQTEFQEKPIWEGKNLDLLKDPLRNLSSLSV